MPIYKDTIITFPMPADALGLFQVECGRALLLQKLENIINQMWLRRVTWLYKNLYFVLL